MTAEQYQALTGTILKQSQYKQVVAHLKRSQTELEALLGFTLNDEKREENQYTNLGTSNECSCSGDSDVVDPEGYVYRLFPYNPKDRYFHVDPFTTLNRVRLVKNGYTLRVFEEDEVRAEFKQGWSKYIEVCDTCFCVCSCNDCVQLAVAADWAWEECDIPADLQLLLAEMVDYQIDCNKDLKSKTVGTTSWTKFDRPAPTDSSKFKELIRKYAGPFGLNEGLPI